MIIPKNISLENWAASLIIDFPNDNIPHLKGEDWKSWGNALVLEESFSQNGAPNTKPFNEWDKWAQAVFHTMANY